VVTRSTTAWTTEGAQLSALRCIVLLALAALAAGSAWAQREAIVVGAVISQSGLASDLAAGYRNGILLWQSQLNAAGGLLGRRVELRIADDRSGANEAAEEYQRLIDDGKVDLLIGPYGSAASITSCSSSRS